MDNTGEVFVMKIVIQEKDYYMRTVWPNSCSEGTLFKIYLFGNDCCWSGKFTIKHADIYREVVDENSIDYQHNVFSSLTQDNSQYIYDLSLVNNNLAKFCWKKKFEGSTALLVHGMVDLCREKNEPSKNNLIDLLLQKNIKLQQQIAQTKLDTEQLALCLEKSKKELKEFTDLKIEWETTLYSNFSSLLNTKKKRIEILEELLKNNNGEKIDECDIDKLTSK